MPTSSLMQILRATTNSFYTNLNLNATSPGDVKKAILLFPLKHRHKQALSNLYSNMSLIASIINEIGVTIGPATMGRIIKNVVKKERKFASLKNI